MQEIFWKITFTRLAGMDGLQTRVGPGAESEA
jgi:hypothetical protein